MTIIKAIKAITALLGISAFMYYQYEYLRTGMKPNELFFIASSLCIASFAFLSIEKDDPVFIRSLIVLCSTFFLMVIVIYFKRWVIEQNGSTNYYTALCISAIFTFLYLVYDVFFGRKYTLN